MLFNPPIAWVLTLAEMMLGSWICSLGYPVVGGFIMGSAAGSFFTRATMPRHIARLLERTAPVEKEGD
jgi:amino acid permease